MKKSKNKNHQKGLLYPKWKVLNKAKLKAKPRNFKEIVDILLDNRDLKGKRKKEFFSPSPPFNISLRELGIDSRSVSKTIKKIFKVEKKDKIIIYGDYDADGVCATAILWEALYTLGFDVMPYIPERFSEGYGINAESIKKLISKYPDMKLIVTVDNGIVANEAVDFANEKGIDVIISDHHQKSKKLPKAYSIIHTTKLSGSGISWILAREIAAKVEKQNIDIQVASSLELAAIGTIADQLPLLFANRSIVKFGLVALNNTKRPGLLSLFNLAGVTLGQIGTYEVNYIIAPRINSMGRMKHAIDSLRLLCTKDTSKALKLATLLNKTNTQRQKVVEEVVLDAKSQASKTTWTGVIVLADESYHEGVIGLAASKLVDEYYHPAIVISKGSKYAKASARSISGFNIIEAIRSADEFLVSGGGHPMAAGFTIETKKIGVFQKRLEEISASFLTDEILSKKLVIDLNISFKEINWELIDKIEKFGPTGVGNYTPSFVSYKVTIIDSRLVGRGSKHVKLRFGKNKRVYDAIAFNFGEIFSRLTPDTNVDIAYSLERNVWNGSEDIQLKIKDIRVK